ncbi:uncharacterized protein [Paralichthys olivaceus]|uniref:uncharacterized protein n=1 Tax=Paralichthys olivaceus TaxID=8255 RepID=UPI00375082EE
MDDVSAYLSINRTLFLICCNFWISSLAEGKVITKMVGGRVTLACNVSTITVQQLTWRFNGAALISYKPQVAALYRSEEAESLKINMSLSGTEPYALVIDGVQRSHAGNYSCNLAALEGLWEQNWELIITEKREAGEWHVFIVASTVLFVCCLIFIITLTILQRVDKSRSQDNNQPAPVTELTGDIYENCLEMNVGHQRSCQPHHNMRTAHHR